jgi:hypothetical protein
VEVSVLVDAASRRSGVQLRDHTAHVGDMIRGRLATALARHLVGGDGLLEHVPDAR